MIRHYRLAEHRIVILVLLALGLAALACNVPLPTRRETVAEVETPGPTLPSVPTELPLTPTDTPTTVTIIPVNTWTPLPSITPLPTIPSIPGSTPRPPSPPSSLPTATPAETAPLPIGNRFRYPSFEEFRIAPAADGFTHHVSRGWRPFYCDGCPAERRGDGNPEDLVMGRPTYGETNLPERVHSGTLAQQWYCFDLTCRGGIFQTIDTIPGEECTVSVWVQSWSANGTGFVSDLITQDDRDNSQWRILVDVNGGTNGFAPDLLASRVFGYDDGIYDQYVQITYYFKAESSQATIFFENLRLWPIVNNDNYVDDAEVTCTAP